MSHVPVVESSRWIQLYRWIMHPLPFLEECTDRYGDCFVAQIGNLGKLVVFSQPEAIEQLFAMTPDQVDIGRGNNVLRLTLGDNSVLLLDGDRHKRQRQLLMPPFHGERMKAYGTVIGQITGQVIDRWQVGQSLVMRSQMQEISLEVILRTVFGLTVGPRYERISSLLKQLLDRTMSRFGFASALFPVLRTDLGPWSPGGQFKQLKQAIDDELYAEIRERREHPAGDRTDILSLLMAARDAEGQPMTDVELRDELMTLLIAGHETTATSLSWAFYWIHRTPAVKSRLLEELATLDEQPEASTILRLPYLDAVCSETLRIYPVAFITPFRMPHFPIKVLNYEFEPNINLVPCIYLAHHREATFPEADQFRPERFLERQFSPYEYFPFGGGNRRCIGAAFALFEMKLVLATVLRSCELELAESAPVIPQRRGVTIAPKGGIRMNLNAKHQQPAPVTAIAGA
jgi:unspecific monooxygenase